MEAFGHRAQRWEMFRLSPSVCRGQANTAKGRAPSSYHFEVNCDSGILSPCLALMKKIKAQRMAHPPQTTTHAWEAERIHKEARLG